MEAITCAGLIVVAAGGYYSLIDVLNDLGIRHRTSCPVHRRTDSGCRIIMPQIKVEKVAGMHI